MHGTNEAGHTHRAIVGGEELRFSYDGTDAWKTRVDALVAKHGGVPKIEQIAPMSDEQRSALVAEVMAPVDRLAAETGMSPEPIRTLVRDAIDHGEQAVVRGTTVLADGLARSSADEALAKANGFAPRQPLYARGTAVIDLGVDNAREKRAEFDAMPTTRDACEQFVERIADEQRRDETVVVGDLRMRSNGRLTTLIGPDTCGADMLIGSDAFADLMLRVGPGGGSYLAKCPPKLRAINLNHWAVVIGERDEQARQTFVRTRRETKKQAAWEPTKAVLRTRLNEHADVREVFAAVSEGYTAFDVDRIAAALRAAAPPDARGTVKYDGTRATFDVLFHSDVRPEDYVAGEFFRAGVRVRTDDTGGGGIRVSAIVWQNLCLNLLVIDEAEKKVASLRHVGNVDQLANKFRASFADALDSIAGFRKAWGFAVEDDVLEAARAAQGDHVPLKVSEALPGLFAGILERELVPVRGSKPEAVKRLVEAYSRDDSAATVVPGGGRRDYLSRAAVVNAFTRYAHEAPQPDPFVADAIERAAGSLLFGRGKGRREALPYVEPRG